MTEPTCFGRIEIHQPQVLIAGQGVTVVFDFTVGEGGMREGGKLRIGLPNVGWAKPEVPQYYFWSEFARGKERRYTQYDRVNTTAKVETEGKAVPLLETEPRFYKPWRGKPRWLTEYDRFWITVTLEDDGLAAGDHVVVTYGDPEQLPLTARVQGMPEDRLNYMVLADPKGDGRFFEADGSPWMTEVVAGPASRVDCITPSVIRPGEPLEARVAYTDQVKAWPRPVPTIGSLRVETEELAGAPQEVAVNRETDAVRVTAPPPPTGHSQGAPLHVTVADVERGWSARSNPTLVRAKGRRVFWGDLHGQSQFHGWSEVDQKGMSCHLPRECYRYARDIAGLDFCAITDTRSIAQDIWQDTVEQADEMYEPGRFVAFYGSEVGDDVNGHRNLVFGGNDPPQRIHPSMLNAKGDNFVDLETPHMHQRFAGRDDLILVPHHVKMWADWDCYDPVLEPVLEIYSIWGGGERPGTDLWEILREMTGGAQEAWARGYRIGVIAGSDTHAGLPGRSMPDCDRDDFMPYKAGYAAVWAEELTRESVFRALKRRHCYGTTGARIILETFIDGHPMGSEVAWPEVGAPRELEIRVWGTDDIQSVTVVKNNQDVHTFSPRQPVAELTWVDRDPARSGDYTYVRVIQRDGNRAWSSPIWVDVER